MTRQPSNHKGRVVTGPPESFRPTTYVRPGAKDRPNTISDVLSSSFDRLGIAQRLKEYRIFKAWGEAVGKQIARRTAPKRLMGTKLYVNVSSQAWMTELMYQKATILKKIAEGIGPGVVTEIVFTPGQVSEKVIKKERRAQRGRSTPVKLTDEQKRFIENEAAKIPDAALRKLIERVMGESLSEKA